jgi:hypothetical protein
MAQKHELSVTILTGYDCKINSGFSAATSKVQTVGIIWIMGN